MSSSSAAAAAAASAVDPAHALATAESQLLVQQQQLMQQNADLLRMQSDNQQVHQRLLDSENVRAAMVASANQVRNGAALEARAPRDSHLPKMPSPKEFGGNNGPEVDSWIHGMEKQFSYYHLSFASEAQKVSYASNFLNKSSSAWLTNLNVELTRAGTPITTWVELTEKMRERYQPMQSATIARQRFDTFVQASSVQLYTDHFLQCMLYIQDMSESDQIHQYTRGLKNTIKLEVTRHSPSTVHEAINCAAKAESYLGLRGPTALVNASRYSRFGHQSSASSNTGHAAMDINNVDMFSTYDESNTGVDGESTSESSGASAAAPPAWAAHIHEQAKMNQKILALFGDNKKFTSQKSSSSSKSKVPGVSKADFSRCWAEGLCINCKKPGHVARDCKNAKANF